MLQAGPNESVRRTTSPACIAYGCMQKMPGLEVLTCQMPTARHSKLPSYIINNLKLTCVEVLPSDHKNFSTFSCGALVHSWPVPFHLWPHQV